MKRGHEDSLERHGAQGTVLDHVQSQRGQMGVLSMLSGVYELVASWSLSLHGRSIYVNLQITTAFIQSWEFDIAIVLFIHLSSSLHTWCHNGYGEAMKLERLIRGKPLGWKKGKTNRSACSSSLLARGPTAIYAVTLTKLVLLSYSL